MNIFLSYRRDDSEADTRTIKMALEHAGHHPFMDLLDIDAGKRWPDTIRSSLTNADIVIAIIGATWLSSQNPDGRRRIDNPEDWVHLELKTAIQTKKKIIPILIRGAQMPLSESLPDDLKDLSSFQAVTFTSENWDSNIQKLLKTLESPHKKKPLFILTSESPRRKELLKQIGWEENIDYVAIHASVNLGTNSEQNLSLEAAIAQTEKIAQQKITWFISNSHDPDISAKFAMGLNPSETIIIGVDTIVFCKGKILDRPLLRALHLAGKKELAQARIRAKEMLLAQKNEQICIITSLAVAVESDNRNPAIKTVITKAKLRPYSESDIDNYIFYAEPFDKAGAFGIQEKGVSLFENINGSYTNIVGLPLQEFESLLNEKFGDKFILPALKSTLQPSKNIENKKLSVVCVGDINYDYIYDRIPDRFFENLRPPGGKIIGPIHRGAGGTAVNFAKGANKAGFALCYVVGVIGGDGLGQEIVKELHNHDIVPIYKTDPNEKTSIAVIFRDTAKEDTSITITDEHQSLTDFVVNLAQDTIKKSDVIYCSGYCLTDDNRQSSALKIMNIAKEAGRLVVLDIVVGMNHEVNLDELLHNLSNGMNHKTVDVATSELPEIFDWYKITIGNKPELEIWEQNKGILINQLREKFSVSILRTSKYTHEIIITPNNVLGPYPLEYGSVEAREKVGYGDFRTAKQVHALLSPRIVLASKSPQRFNLLNQIVAPSKIEVVVSHCNEENVPYETPQDRVKRLALAKAEAVFSSGKYHNDIELIIGADTEIIRQIENDEWRTVGHPTNREESIRDLMILNGKPHIAITGIAIIGREPKTGRLKKITDCIETKVFFANLSEEQIRTYAETGESIGRAGAYAIQGLGAMLIQNLEGSYSNVVGLPLEKLCQILAEEFDKPIWKFDKVSNWEFPNPIKNLNLG